MTEEHLIMMQNTLETLSAYVLQRKHRDFAYFTNISHYFEIKCYQTSAYMIKIIFSVAQKKNLYMINY